MALTEADLVQVGELVAAEVAAAIADIMPPADVQCNALIPHGEGMLSFRGEHYACRCGMVYSKDGRGGLKVGA